MEILVCYTICTSKLQSTDFIFRNSPPVFLCCSYLKAFFFFLIAKPHDPEATYTERCWRLSGNNDSFHMNCLSGFEKRGETSMRR